jgi:hypothetical protein
MVSILNGEKAYLTGDTSYDISNYNDWRRIYITVISNDNIIRCETSICVKDVTTSKIYHYFGCYLSAVNNMGASVSVTNNNVVLERCVKNGNDITSSCTMVVQLV